MWSQVTGDLLRGGNNPIQSRSPRESSDETTFQPTGTDHDIETSTAATRVSAAIAAVAAAFGERGAGLWGDIRD